MRYSIFIIFIALIFLTGCATFEKMLETIQEVPGEEIAAQQNALTTLLTDAPQPYATVGAFTLGWLAAFLRAWYRKKKDSKD